MDLVRAAFRTSDLLVIGSGCRGTRIETWAAEPDRPAARLHHAERGRLATLSRRAWTDIMPETSPRAAYASSLSGPA
jgi:hypothetical protein